MNVKNCIISLIANVSKKAKDIREGTMAKISLEHEEFISCLKLSEEDKKQVESNPDYNRLKKHGLTFLLLRGHMTFFFTVCDTGDNDMKKVLTATVDIDSGKVLNYNVSCDEEKVLKEAKKYIIKSQIPSAASAIREDEQYCLYDLRDGKLYFATTNILLLDFGDSNVNNGIDFNGVIKDVLTDPDIEFEDGKNCTKATSNCILVPRDNLHDIIKAYNYNQSNCLYVLCANGCIKMQGNRYYLRRRLSKGEKTYYCIDKDYVKSLNIEPTNKVKEMMKDGI